MNREINRFINVYKSYCYMYIFAVNDDMRMTRNKKKNAIILKYLYQKN